jgi:hypothetical protein
VLWLGFAPGRNVDAALKKIGELSHDESVRRKANELLAQRSAHE